MSSVPISTVAASGAEKSSSEEALPSSFRDPAGFVFRHDGVLYRQVGLPGQADYRCLMQSGLYRELIDAEWLISHHEVPSPFAGHSTSDAPLFLQPEEIPFVSYPYEWCFGQHKDAALTTLAVQKLALSHGMSLKDASAYNIQFHHGKPVLIDTLSLEVYREGEPWAAYRQFCQHFLAPLALTAYGDVRLASALLRSHLDGIPLDLAHRLLPLKTRLIPGLLIHLHLHAAAQSRFAAAEQRRSPAPTESINPQKHSGSLGKTALRGLIDGLESTIRRLDWKPAGTEWADYYAQTNYSNDALSAKERLVSAYLDGIHPAPQTVWDVGANNGRFSRLAVVRGARTVAWDVDPSAVEQNYRTCRRDGETNLLPLLLDLTNPSPGLGWESRERDSLMERGPAEIVLALALLHHLTITHNVPFGHVARFFARLCRRFLIIEFVPADDSQAQRLLSRRAGVFPGYTEEAFVTAFAPHFTVERKDPVPGTRRTLYCLRKI